MGLNIDSSVKTNKPIIINKKKGLEKQTEKALNDYNSIREKIDSSSSNRVLNKPTGEMSLKTKKFIIA